VNLWLFDVGGGTMRRLTAFRSGETTGAAWFAGGRRVAYAHDGRIIVHGLDSRDLRGSIREYASPVPRRSVGDLAVSPDERRVIFRVGGSGAWLLDLDDGSMRCVLTDPTAESFAWSADGRRVAYYSRRDDEWGVWIMAAQS
jgi:Tol biopolymer transport system component